MDLQSVQGRVRLKELVMAIFKKGDRGITMRIKNDINKNKRKQWKKAKRASICTTGLPEEVKQKNKTAYFKATNQENLPNFF